MTGRPTDEDLRAMLEARAAALPPGAARDVLAGARAAIAGPSAGNGAGVAFHPRPVAAIRRTSRTPWGIAAVAAAAVVAITLLGSRVQLDRPSASSAVAGATVGPSASDGGQWLGDITAEQLRSRLVAGDLDGKVVIVRGRVFLVQGRCLRVDCTFVKLDGLPDVFIGKGDRTAEATQAAIDRYGMSAPVVLRGADQSLDLVGWLVDGADAPIGADALTQVREQVPDGILSVVGWLHPEGDVVAFTSSKEPGRGQGVAMYADPSLRPAPGTAPGFGMFLAMPTTETRLGTPTRWDLVGRLDPSSTVWVQQPRTDLAGPTIPAADLMAALDDGALNGQVFAIDGELKTVAWECPIPEPCSRFYMHGLPGVAVTWDGGLLGSDGTPGAPVSVMSGRMLVTPRDGYLELLGRLPGPLDVLAPVDEIAPGRLILRLRDPLQLEAIRGWLLQDLVRFCAMTRPGEASRCDFQSSLASMAPDATDKLPPAATRTDVAIHKGAPGIANDPVTEGPFLVRQAIGSTCDQVRRAGDPACAGGRTASWLLVARYDPEAVRVVTFP